MYFVLHNLVLAVAVMQFELHIFSADFWGDSACIVPI